MNPTFDLTLEKWIPCVPESSGPSQEYGIRETLLQAHELLEVSDNSPLITVSLYRLLLAVLYRCWQPETEEEFETLWQGLWEAGRFPADTIDAYLEEWRPRFDLFSDSHPFYQTANFEVVKVDKKGVRAVPDSILRLINEALDGGGPVLFDHRMYTQVQKITPAQSARLLTAAQSFGTCTSQSGRAKIGLGDIFDPGGREDGICLRGMTMWLSGNNLFETLMLNFVPNITPHADTPSWEQNPIAEQISNYNKYSQTPKGLAERYTWQGRLIRLLPEPHGNDWIVPQVHYTQGRSLKKGDIDPMKCYGIVKDKGYVPVSLSRRKASWRDVHSLLAIRSSQLDKTPEAFNHVREYMVSDILPRSANYLYGLNIVGMAGGGEAAKFVLWRHDRMAIPLRLLTDADRVERLGLLLRTAEDTHWRDGNQLKEGMARQLYVAIRRVCAAYLPDLKKQDGNGSGKTNPDVIKLVEQLDPRSAYWSRLETHFQHLLSRFGEEDTMAAETEWREAIVREAYRAFNEALRGLGTSVRASQAIAREPAHFKVA